MHLKKGASFGMNQTRMQTVLNQFISLHKQPTFAQNHFFSSAPIPLHHPPAKALHILANPFGKSLDFSQIFICLFIFIFQLNQLTPPASMKQKRNKPRYNQQFKTFNSEQSCIDIFSRVQSLFLQKFFRYNLSDYFHDLFINVEEDLLLKRIKNKQLKQLTSETFLTKKPILIKDFEMRMNQFYNMEHTELWHSFKYLYTNLPPPETHDIGEKELVMVQVKMRAEIQKIQNLPQYFYRELELCQSEQNQFEEKEEEELITHLKKYEKKVLNLFIVYFGDINFDIFDTKQYQPKTVHFLGNQLTVKIYVFFVSRLALIDKFKKINKIEHLQYVNDLLIQLYQFKREKIRAKRMKNKKNNAQPPRQTKKINTWFHSITFMKWFTIFSVAGLTLGVLGALYLKFFF